MDTNPQNLPAYIYALLDPDTQECRYVGKSENPVSRFKQHLAIGRHGHSHRSDRSLDAKSEWVKELCDAGKVPLLAVLEETTRTPQEWGPVEQRWIKRLTDEGHRFLNAQVVKGYRTDEEKMQDALQLGRDLFDTNT